MVPQDQVIYVGKHGNDANTGTTPDAAKLTLTAGITAAVALTPASDNRVSVVCNDAGNYTEDLSIPSWVGVIAPAAKVTGNHLVADNSLLNAFRLVASSGVAVTKSVGTGVATVECPRMVLSGAAGGAVCTAGVLDYTGDSIEVEDGFGLGNLSTEAIHARVTEVTVTGTGIGIGIASSGALVYNGADICDSGSGTGIYLASTGQVDATLSRLDCATAYNVATAGSELRLIVARLAGTRTATGVAHVVSSKSYNTVNVETVTGSVTLSETADHVCLDGTLAPCTVTLYGSPVDGQRVSLKAVDITNTVKLSGPTIDGVTGDYTFASKGDAITLVWDNDNSTWEVF